jgi:hypothetical protein
MADRPDRDTDHFIGNFRRFPRISHQPSVIRHCPGTQSIWDRLLVSPRLSEVTIGGGVLRINSATVTVLSSYLAPPERPSLDKPDSTFVVVTAVVASLGFLLLLVMIGQNSDDPTKPQQVPPPWLYASFWLVAWIVFFGLAITRLMVLYNKDKIAIELAREEKRIMWMNQCRVWSHLYYCSRDNIVFSPKTSVIY